MKSLKIQFLIFLCCLSTISIYAQQKPNVIFILADDMGYGDLGCYGSQLIETPNIDKLASGGIRFTQFYAGTSVCAPSRASLMTGLHTGHTPIRGNYEIQPEGQLPLPDSSFIMPEMFKAAGYKTAVFGKWGMGYPGSEGDPVKQGVDQFYGYNCQRQSHNFFPDHLWDNSSRVELSNTLTDQQQYAPALIQKQAMAFMEQHKSVPFFMYLAYTLPHAALQLPVGDEVFEHYKKKFNEQPKAVKDWNGVGYQPQAYPHAAYAAMVTKLDRYVGEVVDRLKSLGLDKNTMIIFTSDNGPHKEGGNEPTFFNSSGGFRGIKRQLTEGGIREPVIVNWAGKIQAGKVSDHIGAFWDFLPTFSDLAGQALPFKSDGISLLPLLLNKGKQAKHEFLYWEFHEDGGRQAVRMGKWKGIKEGVIKNANASIALYDLEADPKESVDLGQKHPDLVRKIQQIMFEQHVEHKDFPFINDVLQQKLESIINAQKARVGISVKFLESGRSVSVNGDQHYPMQSVYKFHLALAVLNQVDKGKFSLHQNIFIKKSDLLPDTWSPLREKYPDGNVSIPLSEIIRVTVAESDNNGCDILFRLLGGPNVVHQYIANLGIKDCAIVGTEEDMHRDDQVQFANWTTPKAANALMELFYKGQLLKKKTHTFLMKTMEGTVSGPNKIKGLLPAGTTVAHKTGNSGINKDGIMAASNDIGIVTLPNGEKMLISVFVSMSNESEQKIDQIIAKLAKAAWDEGLK